MLDIVHRPRDGMAPERGWAYIRMAFMLEFPA
jgi:hypothetical protein